jgi:broad specificity phosphatase PhoE
LWNERRLLQGRTDIALCEKGREQAKILSSALTSIPFSSIYCSPLSRAKETAEILAMPHDLTPRPDQGFVEISFGDWEGKSHESLAKKAGEQYAQWIIKPTEVTVAGAEQLKEAQARAMRSLEKIVRENEKRVVVVVGHGGINRVILLSLLEADLGAFWRMRQDTTCVNLIEFSDDIPRISLLNCTAHFKTDYTQIVKTAMTRNRISLEDQS